jgi:hypothetical protein
LVAEQPEKPRPERPELFIFSLEPVSEGEAGRGKDESRSNRGPPLPVAEPSPGPERRHRVLAQYEATAWEFRRRHRLGGSGFDRRVIRAFETTIAQAYWQALLDHLRRAKNASPDVIARALRKNRATVWRWFKKRTEPELGSFLAFLTAFDIDVRDVHFPRGREAVNHARAAAVTHIRRREWPAEPACPALDRIGLECLYHLCLSRPWLDAQLAGDRAALERAAADVCERVRRHFPRAAPCNADELQEILRQWLIPWCLFSTVPLYDWPC